MLNLAVSKGATQKKTVAAKLRVKSDIFAPWEEAIDHQVRGWRCCYTRRSSLYATHALPLPSFLPSLPPSLPQVCVLYTQAIGDEKRDPVEYTSAGFLGAKHTMLTYTRCMDSILCVPLMIDAAMWCDFFSRHGAADDVVARATAYLFKVPEGKAKGVDPGFFRQMAALEGALREAAGGEGGEGDKIARAVAGGIISEAQAAAMRAL